MLVVLDPFPAPGQAIELEGGRAPERLPIGIEYEVRPTFGWCCLECGERNGNVFRRDAEETADRNDRGRHGAVLLNDEIDVAPSALVKPVVPVPKLTVVSLSPTAALRVLTDCKL